MSLYQRSAFLFLGLAALLFAGCSKVKEPFPDRPGKRVLASFPPIYCFAQNVAGDDANVLCLLTTNDPHDYSVAYSDVLKVRKANLFLCNGLDLETRFLGKLVEGAGQSMGLVIQVGDKLPHDELLHPEHDEMPSGKEEKHAHGKDGHGHDHHHEHGDHDPHVWLSPRLASLMVDQVAGALGRIDPGHKTNFEERAAKYKKELEQLMEEGKAAFKGKKNRKIVTQHDSLRYFARDFDLEIVGNIRLASGIENDPKAMANLIKRCKEENIAAITAEPHYPVEEAKQLQRTLQNQGVETKIAIIDPLETVEVPSGAVNPDPDVYVKTMRRNIENLAKALP